MMRYSLLVGTLSLVAGLAHADLKLGYVDMQKAIQETTTGKKAKKELEDEFNKRKKELEKDEVDIKKAGEDFEKRSMAMNEEARAKKQTELQTKMRKYQETAGKAQMEIQKKEHDLTQPIVTKLRSLLESIAKKEDFAFVLEKSESSVMFAKKEFDLTDRLVREYDKK